MCFYIFAFAFFCASFSMLFHFSSIQYREREKKIDMDWRMLFPAVSTTRRAKTASMTVFFIYYFNCIARNQYVIIFDHADCSIFFSVHIIMSIVKNIISLAFGRREMVSFNPSSPRIINIWKIFHAIWIRTCLSIEHFLHCS